MGKKILLAVILVLAGVLFFKRTWAMNKVKEIFGKDERQKETDEKQESEDTGKTKYTEQEKPPFKNGSKGKRVETIQKALNMLHNSGLVVDGLFGPATEQACINAGYGKTIETKDILKMTKLLKEKKGNE